MVLVEKALASRPPEIPGVPLVMIGGQMRAQAALQAPFVLVPRWARVQAPRRPEGLPTHARPATGP